MTNSNIADDGSHHIRLGNETATSSIAALRDYLEQCDNRRIAPDTYLFLTAEDRLGRDNIITALPLCINILRIGTTLVFPNGEQLSRADMTSNLSAKLVLALATLDETSREGHAD
jgi:hypothetical protein